MICSDCARAADQNKPKLHKKCKQSHCTCQHRVGAVVIKSGGANVKETVNGDGS